MEWTGPLADTLLVSSGVFPGQQGIGPSVVSFEGNEGCALQTVARGDEAT